MERVRVAIPAAVAIAACSAAITAGVTWGMYSARSEAVERQVIEQSQIVRRHETQIAVLETKLDTIIVQLREANERLARLEGKQR